MICPHGCGREIEDLDLTKLRKSVGVDGITRYHDAEGPSTIRHVCVGLTTERMAEISALQDLPTQPEQLADAIKSIVLHASMDKATKTSLSLIIDELSKHAVKDRAAALGAIKELTELAKLSVRPEDDPSRHTWIVVSISDKALAGMEKSDRIIDELWAEEL